MGASCREGTGVCMASQGLAGGSLGTGRVILSRNVANDECQICVKSRSFSVPSPGSGSLAHPIGDSPCVVPRERWVPVGA